MSSPLSNNFIKQVKKCGIYNYLKDRIQLTKNGNVYMGRCPHPDHNDSSPSFRIFIDENTGEESWACMGCHCGKKDGKTNFGTDNIALIRWLSSNKNSTHVKDFKEAVLELANFYNVSLEYDKYSHIYTENKNIAINNMKELSNHQEVLQYLYNDRGLSKEDILKWQIGYDGNRITFPIYDKYNNIIGFSNRAFSEASLNSGCKYKNSKASEVFDKKRIFYGINYYNNNRKSILITEGQFDVILAHKYGIDFAVGTMCCHLSDYHIQTIKQMNKIPILCYDLDEAGQKGIISAVDLLQQAGINNIKILPLPMAGCDLADTCNYYKNMTQAYVYDNTKNYFLYRLSKIADVFDSKVNELQQSLLPEVFNMFNNIQDEQQKIIMKNFIYKRLHLYEI